MCRYRTDTSCIISEFILCTCLFLKSGLKGRQLEPLPVVIGLDSKYWTFQFGVFVAAKTVVLKNNVSSFTWHLKRQSLLGINILLAC